MVGVEAVHRVEQLEEDRVGRLERPLHRYEVDVLENDDRRRQRGRQLDRGRHGAETVTGQQHDRAAAHLRGQVHRGERLADTRRTVQQHAAAHVASARPQPLRVARHAEGGAFDALQHTVGQHDPLARDRRQRADRERGIVVAVKVARAQLEDASAVDVALIHQPPQLGDDRFGAATILRHHLERERLAHAVVGAGQHDRKPLVPFGHEPQPELYARDALVLAERDGHVLGRADADRAVVPAAGSGELGQPDLDPGHRREADELGATLREEGIDRDLEVGAIPRLQRARDDRQPGRVGAEVLTQPLAQFRLGLRRVLLGPRGETLDRAGEFLGLHGDIFSPRAARVICPRGSATLPL